MLLDFAGRVDFTHLALLQATSPLLTSDDLQRGCAAFAEGGTDSVFSAVRQKRFRWSRSDDGSATPDNYDPRNRPRRQDAEGFLVENGAFYITSRESLLESQCRMSGRTVAVEMPEDTYFELDDLFDWTIMEGLMRRRQQLQRGDWRERLPGLRLVASDVDGCLTDSGMYYSEQGDELKKFSTRDGMGFRLLQEAGFDTAIITLENTELMARRAKKLKIEELHQAAEDKVGVMDGILSNKDYGLEQVAYLGDDLGDVELLKRVGVSACPSDAIPAVRDAVDIVLQTPGGSGAFREFSEMILESRR